MKAIIYILGFGHIILSACLILYTRETVDAVRRLYLQFPLKYLAALPALFGFLFLIAASATLHPWFLRAIAFLALGEALIAFTNPGNIYSRALDWYFGKLSDQGQRLIGIIGIIFGTVLLSWIK